MATSEQIRIGEHVYEVFKLPAMRALKLSARIAKVVGPAISTAGKPETIAQALFDRLDPDELEKILRELFASTTIDNRELMPLFDVVFAGNLQDVVPLAGFALKTQFGSLFNALVAAAPSVAIKPAEPGSSSPET